MEIPIFYLLQDGCTWMFRGTCRHGGWPQLREEPLADSSRSVGESGAISLNIYYTYINTHVHIHTYTQIHGIHIHVYTYRCIHTHAESRTC